MLALLRQRDVIESQARDHLRLLEELAFHYRFCGKSLTYSFVEDTATWLAKESGFGSPRDKAWRHSRNLKRVHDFQALYTRIGIKIRYRLKQNSSSRLFSRITRIVNIQEDVGINGGHAAPLALNTLPSQEWDSVACGPPAA